MMHLSSEEARCINNKMKLRLIKEARRAKGEGARDLLPTRFIGLIPIRSGFPQTHSSYIAVNS